MTTEKMGTPRTDAEYWRQFPNGADGWDFARALERENERLREALTACVSCMPVNDPMYTRQLETAWNQARAALAARQDEGKIC